MVQGLKDPEAKRKAIGAGFIEVFNDFAKGFDRKPRFLVQVHTHSVLHVTQTTLPCANSTAISDHMLYLGSDCLCDRPLAILF